MPHKMSRAAYAQMFGPTVGDKVRLADTDLIIEVEKDFTTYGEEVKFGGGKIIRDGMGQSQRLRSEGPGDTVITNALILEHWGIGSVPKLLVEQREAGAWCMKLHEEGGAPPAAIDCCLSVADDMDVQVAIHTDSLNESGFVENTIAAFKGRTIHTFHTEGAGGGHAPDIIKVCGEANVLPASTSPTRPYTVDTLDDAFDMLNVTHHPAHPI